jgi:ABC-2 type transport system ATP-binding protein
LKTTLKKLHQEGMTMLISSHDLAHITEISDRMILLEKGKVIEDKPKTEETLGELETYFTVL